MIVTHKITKERYSAILESVPIITPKASYSLWYVRLSQINGIKSDMCEYTQAVKRYTFPKLKV